MPSLPRLVTAALLPLGLSACQLDLLDYRDRLKDEAKLANEISQMHPTAFRAMPITGSAEFTGTGNLYIDRNRDTQGDGLFLIGDATLIADFENSTLTGVVDDLQGATNVRLNSQGKVVRRDVRSIDASGSIELGNMESVIGRGDGTRTSRPNDWFADYGGTVQVGGEAYVLDGEVSGQFYGTRVNNPNTDIPTKALAGGEELYSGSTATSQGDGTAFDANLTIVTEHKY